MTTEYQPVFNTLKSIREAKKKSRGLLQTFRQMFLSRLEGEDPDFYRARISPLPFSKVEQVHRTQRRIILKNRKTLVCPVVFYHI